MATAVRSLHSLPIMAVLSGALLSGEFKSRPKTVMFRVTGANGNARKLLSPDSW